MKRVFLDANIVLDLLDSQRSGHAAALRLEDALEASQANCMCAWHTLSIIVVPSTGTEEARKAFEFLSGDYEDALQIASAVAGSADYLVTRDKTGYDKSPVEVVNPEQLCGLLVK